jgi:hypothetical protein
MTSEPSPVLEVNRPDVIPPSPALIGDYKVLPDGIRLTILPSSSRDVVRHEIYRREGTEDWELLTTLTDIPSSWVDQHVSPQTEYRYKVIAIDDNGLASHSVKDIVIESMAAPLTAPEIRYVLDGKQMTLEILAGHQGIDNQFVVYRAAEGQKIARYQHIQSPTWTEELQETKTYTYRVRTQGPDGRMSPFSNAVTVQIPTQ